MQADCSSSLALLRTQLHGERPFAMNGSRLLFVGAGRSGTHAIWNMLNNMSIAAGHETLHNGDEATVGWPFAARCEPSIAACGWRFPKGGIWVERGGRLPSAKMDPYGLIFKVHREPLATIYSLAKAFAAEEYCSESIYAARADARSWRYATAVIGSPVNVSATHTCQLKHEMRLRLALHYWLQWNLLSDAHADVRFSIERVSAAAIASAWCDHCHARRGTLRTPCQCPAAARVLAHAADAGDKKPSPRDSRRRGNSTTIENWSQLNRLDPMTACMAQTLAVKEYGYRYHDGQQAYPSPGRAEPEHGGSNRIEGQTARR